MWRLEEELSYTAQGSASRARGTDQSWRARRARRGLLSVTRKKIITRRRPARASCYACERAGSSCSVGLRDYSWPVVCTSSASCQAHSEGDHTFTMSCVSAAPVVSQVVLLTENSSSGAIFCKTTLFLSLDTRKLHESKLK